MTMKTDLFRPVLALGLVLAAFSAAQAAEPAKAAAHPAEARVATAAADAAALKRGKLLFIQCRACHELEQGKPHRVGPNLYGFMGTKAGELDGFGFSPAMRKADFTWDIAHLDQWIEKPAELIPGNTMAYAGLRKPEDRAALIAYLIEETKKK